MEKSPTGVRNKHADMLEALRHTLAAHGTVTVAVHVRPHAAESVVTGVLADGSVKLSVHAPPEDGKANHEAQRLLAEEFGVGLQHVELLSGPTSRRKVFRITG